MCMHSVNKFLQHLHACIYASIHVCIHVCMYVKKLKEIFYCIFKMVAIFHSSKIAYPKIKRIQVCPLNFFFQFRLKKYKIYSYLFPSLLCNRIFKPDLINILIYYTSIHILFSLKTLHRDSFMKSFYACIDLCTVYTSTIRANIHRWCIWGYIWWLNNYQ